MGYSVGLTGPALLRGGISRVTDITLGRLAQSYDLRSLGDCRTSLALRGDLTVGSFGRSRKDTLPAVLDLRHGDHL